MLGSTEHLLLYLWSVPDDSEGVQDVEVLNFIRVASEVISRTYLISGVFIYFQLHVEVLFASSQDSWCVQMASLRI